MNKKKIITLSFDDGHLDNMRVIDKLLIPNGIPATFNIATGYIDGEVKLGGYGFGAMTKNDVVEIYQNPLFEVACHSHYHTNRVEDICRGRDVLCEWLGNDYVDEALGFASPECGLSPKHIHENKRMYSDMGFSYIRTGPTIHTLYPIRLGCRRISRIFPSQALFRIAYQECVQVLPIDFLVLSIPVLHQIKMEQLQGLIESVKDGVITLMFHSILYGAEYGYDSNWVYDYESFAFFVKWLFQQREMKRLEIMTTRSVVCSFGHK